MGQSRLNEAKDTNYFTLPTGEATLPKAPETARTHDAGKLPLRTGQHHPKQLP